MSKRLLLIALLLIPVVLPAQQQSAVTLRTTALRAEPHSDAKTITTLTAKTPLQILKRQGGWYQVWDGGKHSGWVRMSHIRVRTVGGTAKKNDSGVAQTVDFLSTGRSGASGVTVATGIRGLDSADVSNAKPDHKAVKQLDNYKVSSASAGEFAVEGELHETELRYFKESK
jgi:uncharacterized protein YgiM (DUF1202 family)